MPPFNKRRLPGGIRRWRRSLRSADTPPLITCEGVDDESDENSSPISKKSEIPFTFERKRRTADDDDEAGSDPEDGEMAAGTGTSGDAAQSTVKEQPVGTVVDIEEEPESDSESEMESDIGTGLGSGHGSNTLPPPPPPPPPPSPLPPPPSTTTATIATTFTPLPPASTTTASPLTLVPNTPTQKTHSTSTKQQPSDMFIPVVAPTIGIPTTEAVISTMTTTPLSETTTQPRKGLDDPITTTDTVWVTALPFMQSSAIPSSTNLDFPPIYTVLPDSEPAREQDEDDSHNDKKDKDKFAPAGLDPTAEHLLIAAGAIGAFILVCFVGWIVYRTMKKSKNNPWGANNLADKLPWRRKDAMGGSYASGGMYPPTEPPPMYDKSDANPMQAAGYYGAGKMYSPGPGSVARSATGTLQQREIQQENESGSALASIIDQYPEGNGEAMGRNDPGQAVGGALMPGSSYYSQSEPTRQATDSYDPGSRQAYRASELSSISSGFGDGEMIMPQPQPPSQSQSQSQSQPEPESEPAAAVALAKPPPIPTSNSGGGRFSWMSRGDGRRETVYTQTSEDRPARFRSVASWVNQQTGRIKRADSRARDRGEVPVMPAIPGQISVTQQTAYR